MGGAQFVFPDQPIKGEKDYKFSGDYKAKNGEDALVLKVKTEGQEKEITLVGSKGKQGVPQTVKIGKLEFTFFFGSKVYTLPFSLKSVSYTHLDVYKRQHYFFITFCHYR